jgi:hypothetical protein
VSSIDQGGRKRRAGMGNHFSSRHSPNSNSMASTANPASKTTGSNQSIFVAIAKPHRGSQELIASAAVSGCENAGPVCATGSAVIEITSGAPMTGSQRSGLQFPGTTK